jgi:hypothetical protein
MVTRIISENSTKCIGLVLVKFVLPLYELSATDRQKLVLGKVLLFVTKRVHNMRTYDLFKTLVIPKHALCALNLMSAFVFILDGRTRGSTCVPHLSFCLEETSIDASCQILTHLSTQF